MKTLWTILLTLTLAGIGIAGGTLMVEFQRKGLSDYIDQVIHSEILDERRVLNIRLPWDYDQSDVDYPLIIKMDGDARLRRHDETLDVLRRINGTTDAIIVAIPNAIGQRNRDLTPSGWLMDSDGGDATGDGDRFLDFIESEVIPHMESQYRTTSTRILFGYSRGGLMAVHGLIERPSVYDGAVALSPAFWRDDERILTDMEAKLAYGFDKPTFLFMAIGEDENDKMKASFSRMERLLEAQAPDALDWSSHHIQAGNHQSTPIMAIPHAYVAMHAFTTR